MPAKLISRRSVSKVPNLFAPDELEGVIGLMSLGTQTEQANLYITLNPKPNHIIVVSILFSIIPI